MKIGKTTIDGEFKEFPIKLGEIEKFIEDAINEKLKKESLANKEDFGHKFFFPQKIKVKANNKEWVDIIIVGKLGLFADATQ